MLGSYAGRGWAPGRGHHDRQDPAGHYTRLRVYIEGRSVPTLGRTLVVNFVNSTALSGITPVVHTATSSYVIFGLAHDPDSTPSATKPVGPDVTEYRAVHNNSVEIEDNCDVGHLQSLSGAAQIRYSSACG
jgi:hypothetical protein